MRNLKPLVSISFPVYNGESFLEASLNSALNQDYDNIEFLIVDDKGPKEAMSIVNNIVSSSNRNFKFIKHEQNLGQGFARNTSIDNASGEYIFFMDSDDLLTENCISVMVGSMMNNPVDFVEGSCVSYNKGVETKKICRDENININKLVVEAKYEDNITISSFMWNKLYDLNFLKDNNIYCTHRYLEDFHFSFKVFCNATSCVLLSDVTYKYVFRPNSTSKTLMSGKLGMPKKSIDIVKDIVLAEYKIIDSLSGVTREKVLLDTIGFGMMYLYHSYNSPYTNKKDTKEYYVDVFNYPKLQELDYSKFSDYEKKKHKYYRVLEYLPNVVKFMFFMFFNYKHYKKKGI